MLERNLRSLVDTEDVAAVARETVHLLRLMSPGLALAPVKAAFQDMKRLFAGRCPGWRACNTEYHDVHHTTDTLLAMMRLMHGAFVTGLRFSDADLVAAALSAMFHDSGYIQAEDDTEGTGAKYTACHVERSVVFLAGYLKPRDFPADYPALTRSLLLCTGLHVDIASIRFAPGNAKLLGQMLGAGDLLGQMSARTYLEKLLFLYHEFQEGRIPGFVDEFDMLQKTFAFNEETRRRLAQELGGVDRFMRPHFRARWGVDRDLCAEAIAQNLESLRGVIAAGPEQYRERLRRDGLVEKLERAHGRRPPL
ncbi:MAG: hypothetical protein PHU21_03630 [Elusimicrobia bacterium]|nr:hypothetical protein [Elusimicrobiota bacterium]